MRNRGTLRLVATKPSEEPVQTYTSHPGRGPKCCGARYPDRSKCTKRGWFQSEPTRCWCPTTARRQTGRTGSERLRSACSSCRRTHAKAPCHSAEEAVV